MGIILVIEAIQSIVLRGIEGLTFVYFLYYCLFYFPFKFFAIFFWQMLKLSPLKSSDQHFLVIKCHCRTYYDNIVATFGHKIIDSGAKWSELIFIFHKFLLLLWLDISIRVTVHLAVKGIQCKVLILSTQIRPKLVAQV